MPLTLDPSKTYAIALEGGGAKGAYEIGVWEALREAGIRFDAVAGTSVGALNGALMAMGDFDRAFRLWSDIQFSDVMTLSEAQETELSKLLQGHTKLTDVQQLLPQLSGLVRSRGLDVAPLRAWVRAAVDTEQIRQSPVSLFATTFCITDKKCLELRLNDLPHDEMCDMLLASAYHPAFRLEPLGGKYYADGGFFDALPIHVLVEHGYKNIIAVHMNGYGRERHFRIPDDVTVTHIQPAAELGRALNFDAGQARRNLRLGYFDCRRVLYGNYGREYYVRRSLDDRYALNWLLDTDRPVQLREYLEKTLPAQAKKLDCREGDYYELMLARAEALAKRRSLPMLREWEDRALLAAL